MRALPSSLLLALLCTLPPYGAAAADKHGAGTSDWTGTWAASPFSQANHANVFAADTTLREIVHVSQGGSAIRIVLSNEFGATDLKIGAASVALPTASVALPTAGAALTSAAGAIQASTAVPVRFSGQPSVTIAPGALAISDPVPMRLAAQSDLAVSLFIPAQTVETISFHGFADQTNFGADGNQITAAQLTSPHTVRSWMFLKGVDVTGGAQGAVVCYGDSITDGAHSTVDSNRRWPDVLATRLGADSKTAHLGVLNEGIGGNRVLHDGVGPSALARFDRDVLAQTGVRYLIILEGINDIGRLANPRLPGDQITADDLIAAYEQMITRAHLHGIKVFGATLTPYGGAKYASPAGQAVRDKLNEFIRHGGQLDGVIDFDKATTDPANPKQYLPAYDSGDHLHPSDAGYKAMGEAIDLKLFTK